MLFIDSLNHLPPRLAMQRLVYWGVIVMATLVILFSAVYGYLIPARIEANLDQIFSQRAWARTLATVDGRRVVMRGEIEPGYDLENELRQIRLIPSVTRVDDELERLPKPPATVQVSNAGDDALLLRGIMRGEDADLVVQALSRAFPDEQVRDRVRIDDRVGRPVWLDGLQTALASLNVLDSFSLYGWQDAMLVEGVATDDAIRSKVRYALPASLADELNLDFQIRLAEPVDAPRLSLVVGWNGAALSGEVGSQKQADLLASALRKVASDRSRELSGIESHGDQPDDSEDTLTIGLVTNPKTNASALPFAVAGLLPSLSKVHDLRIATSGEGLAIWGRLDTGEALGEVSRFLDTLPDNLSLDNYLTVDAADRKPELSLFRDPRRLIISGRVPAQGIKNDLLASLRQSTELMQIEEFITVEPNVAFSPWIERWLTLMPALPKSAFGLTVAADSVLVSGQVGDEAEKQFVNDALSTMFPGMAYVDWLTIDGQQVDGSGSISATN